MTSSPSSSLSVEGLSSTPLQLWELQVLRRERSSDSVRSRPPARSQERRRLHPRGLDQYLEPGNEYIQGWHFDVIDDHTLLAE